MSIQKRKKQTQPAKILSAFLSLQATLITIEDQDYD